MEINFFDKNVKRFIEELEEPALESTLCVLDLLEEFGSQLRMPHSKKIGRALFELRVRGRQEIRIFYTFHQGTAFLLLGFIKKTQEIPQKLIRLGKKKLKMLDQL